MGEQVQAFQCGHWTTKNPDGSVPMRCDYCFLEIVQEFKEQKRNGTLRLSPRVMRALIDAPKKMLRDGPRILAEFRRQQELRRKEGKPKAEK